MARPPKNNLDYFSHDNNMRNDPKIKALRSKFGLEGYAAYNMILETISEADLLRIKNDEISIEIMAGDFGVESSKLFEILEYLVKINLIQKKDKWILCRQLEKRSKPVFEKRMRLLDDLRSENDVNTTETMISVPESTQRKGKESKGDKSIEEENKEGKDIAGKPALHPREFFEIYLEINTKLPQPDVFNKDREKKCRARLSDLTYNFKDKFIQAIKTAQNTPFLCGENERGWRADFDWFIANGTNVLKVVEGKYQSVSRSTSDMPRMQAILDETMRLYGPKT